MAKAKKAARPGAIFDMDGVLVDSAEAHYEAWCLLGDEVGKEHPREFFEKTFGMHNREIIPIWLGPEVPRDEVERLSVLKEALYRKVAAETLKPLDGSVDLVRALGADGFLLAVGSSGPPENVQLVLEVLQLGDLFSALSTGADVREGKPDPEVFLKAAEKLGIPPAQCVVFEDAPQGVEAGLRAGSRVIAVSSTRAPEELSEADLVVSSLARLEPATVRDVLQGGRPRV